MNTDEDMPMRQENAAMNFKKVDGSNTEEAIRILAEAFRDDPVINWSCNNPQTLESFFQFTLPVFIPHQLTYLDPQGRGAASWLGPGQKLNWPFSLSNVVKAFKLGGLIGLYRLMISGIKTERYHPKTPHYYLFAIGVIPEHIGKGVGSSLISHALRLCDAEGMPAYLENSKEENLAFYQGHGFKVQRQIRFAAAAPPVWLMWREPVGANRTVT
jgi:ribosomal protein S18 acetylase RimI-like enzyme